MAAAVPIIAAGIAAGTTIYQVHEADVARHNFEIDQKNQKREQDAQLAALYQQQTKQEQEQSNQQQLSLLQKQQEDSTSSNRDSSLAAKKKLGQGGGRESTILTGPQGLNYESNLKTLIGG